MADFPIKERDADQTLEDAIPEDAAAIVFTKERLFLMMPKLEDEERVPGHVIAATEVLLSLQGISYDELIEDFEARTVEEADEEDSSDGPVNH